MIVLEIMPLCCEISVSVAEFRDCFSLYAREKSINSTEQLTTIMRSLGFSPTITEVQHYFTEYQKGKIILLSTALRNLYIFCWLVAYTFFIASEV
jgi:hypothetical protein